MDFDAFYADRACSIRSSATRKSWGYTYRWLQALHPGTPDAADLTVELRIFQRKPDVNRNAGQKFLVFFGQWTRAVH